MKTLIICFAIVGLSTSAAMAKKSMKKPAAASTAMSAPAPTMPFGGPTAADKQMYMKNKRDSGMK
jgi:hypothetical protein